jgi:hypothetical protein
MKQVLVFAVREDWLGVFQDVEAGGGLQYVAAGHFQDDAVRAVHRGAEISGLGQATAESYVNCQSYLVAESATKVRTRRMKPLRGGDRFCIDQLGNPETVWLTPGGLREKDVLLSGCVASVSDSDVSRALMGRFRFVVRRRFSKIKAFHVGPAAQRLLQS